jgi:Na+/H+ antiporter NhaD/arsenite permease-like protein
MNWQCAFAAFVAAAFCLSAEPAFAASTLDGSAMGWPWALPFAGVLLSIAVGPLLFPKIWRAHYGKIAFGWALLTLASLAVFYGIETAAAAFVHTMLSNYASFILLLFALYTVAGGVLVTGTIRASPWNNVGMLFLGTSIASVVGTTGAAMILIRPIIRANAQRKHNTHVILFFIILACNIGGALTPLGDPPLFIGFLKGVDFFWTTKSLWQQTMIVASPVLAIFFALDLWLFRKEPVARSAAAAQPLRLHGRINLLLVGVIIAATLMSAAWKPGIAFNVYGTSFEMQNLLRDGVFVLVALASLRLTPGEHRAANGFTWEPIREVAILFAGIFVAIIPVIAMLKAAANGAFAFLLQAVVAGNGSPHEAAYFWLTGGLSAFLDNAPTYLVFFELAGGNAGQLMGPLAGTLASVSMGAVYMGALTYIGNAPNFMVYAIAQERGISMPNFFGYMLWASIILVPLFALLTLLPIAPLLQLG